MIVLAGNPNVGKSVLFNVLTGLYINVANYSGTTLEMACGYYNGDLIVEAPGVYGLSSMNGEEDRTGDIILNADIVVNVVNSLQLDQDLFLTLQLIDMGIPMVVALNMRDEAAQRGLLIEHRLLAKILGVPVVPISAVSGDGINLLKAELARIRSGDGHSGNGDPALNNKIEPLLSLMSRREALLVAEGDAKLARRYGVQAGAEREDFYRARRERVNRIVAEVVKATSSKLSFSARLEKLMLQPVTGFIFLACTLWIVYQLVGVFLAQSVIAFTEEVMNGYYEPAVRFLLQAILEPESNLYAILAGQYGVLTLTFTYLIGLLFPLVLGIFFILSVLEDTGYMPRIATLLDRVLSAIGLNGQAVIPLLLGFGCVTMAFITTRILASDRERRIAVFLLALGIPCSAQMALNMAVLASTGPLYMVLYIIFMLAIIVFVGTLLGRLLPGQTSPLLIELPPLRLPALPNVWRKTWRRSAHFIREAFPIFIAGTLILGLLDVYGVLQTLRQLLVPVTVSWLHLPEEVADIFMMGLIRKEFGAAAVLSLPMLPLQKFIVILTLSLTVPCVAASMVIFKERGWREGLLVWVVVFIMAFVIGGLATRLLELGLA